MRFAVILVACLCMLLGACGSAPPAPSNGASTRSERVLAVDEYHIGVDDVVSVSVWQNPELSVTVPVRPDGRISMPLLGDVQAGGLTPQQVAANIKRALSQYIREPHVVVILQELNSHEFLSRVRVTGAVNNPLSLAFRPGMSVLDAVLEAGGLTDFASPNRAVLYRKADEETRRYNVNLGDILQKGDLSTNYALEPGDVIAIPERMF
ncbi:MAG TPA: XrtA/PEP-CTERM system exopolysaccharide export protein [Gammaproteobacteria bacterium]|nr:XrtA/PEP-CTERM system exopolysaccharide export protein [Gammaproteobacteria bacterium]